MQRVLKRHQLLAASIRRALEQRQRAQRHQRFDASTQLLAGTTLTLVARNSSPLSCSAHHWKDEVVLWFDV